MSKVLVAVSLFFGGAIWLKGKRLTVVGNSLQNHAPDYPWKADSHTKAKRNEKVLKEFVKKISPGNF